MITTTVVGNIGKDAVIRETNGRKAISFSVAVNESYKDTQGNKVEKTLWVDCTIWREQGQSTEIAKYLVSGSKVAVFGKPSVSAYRTKEGTPGASLALTVRDIELVSSGKDKDASKGEHGAGSEQPGAARSNTENGGPGAQGGGQFDTPESMGIPPVASFDN